MLIDASIDCTDMEWFITSNGTLYVMDLENDLGGTSFKAYYEKVISFLRSSIETHTKELNDEIGSDFDSEVDFEYSDSEDEKK